MALQDILDAAIEGLLLEAQQSYVTYGERRVILDLAEQYHRLLGDLRKKT